MRRETRSVAACAAVVTSGVAWGQYEPGAAWPGYRRDATNRASLEVAAGPATNFLWSNLDFGPCAETGGIAVDADGFVYYKSHIATDERGDGLAGARIYKVEPTFGGVVAVSPDLGGGSGNYAGVSIGVDAIWTARAGNGEPSQVLKLSKADLSVLAAYDLPSTTGTPSVRGLRLGNGVVFAFDRGQNRIVALNMSDGSVAWAYDAFGDAGFFGAMGPVVPSPGGGDAVFYTANTALFPSQLVAADPLTPGLGQDLWFSTPPAVENFAWIGSGALSSDGSTIVTTTFNDGDTPTMWAIDVATGSVVWTVPGQRGTPDELNFFSRPTVYGGTVYQAGAFGVMTKFDAATGAPGWVRRDGGQEITNSVVAAVDGVVYMYGISQGDANSDPDGDGVYDSPADFIVLRDDGATFTELLSTDLGGTLISSTFASSAPALDATGSVYFSGGTWSAARPDDGDPDTINPPRPGGLYKFGPACSLADVVQPFGSVDIFDILGYFDLFAAGLGDINRDGITDIFDILRYFDLFGAGCG